MRSLKGIDFNFEMMVYWLFSLVREYLKLKGRGQLKFESHTQQVISLEVQNAIL
jgi:hypothetical protein